MSTSLHPHKHLKNKSSITQSPLPTSNSHILNITNPPIIRDVWEDNFEEEFAVIMNLAEQYKVIGMDTEFPGIVYRLNENDLGQLSSIHEIEYKTIKINTDNLKVIQVGLSFANEEGHLLDSVTSWQFNFKFDLGKDEYANDAVDLLVNSGIKFEEHASRGINPQRFAEYLIASGILFNEEIKWISFHGGFDFAYLIRMLHGQNLPDDEQGFYNLLNIYFPSFFDIKYMVRDLESLKTGGLNKIANELNVRRIGPQHQAGSDSLLTLATYFKLKGAYFKNSPDGRYANVLYGIGANGEEGLNDYVWQNFVSQDYTSMMYNGYGIGGMSIIDPYYSQADNVYNNHYNMSYPTANYSNYGPTSYMDANNKFKKYEMYTGKAKN